MEEADVTSLLIEWRSGSEQALERLSPFVYEQLRRLARKYMAGERQGHTLQATALVNEAFLRLVGTDVDFESRRHFFRLAARMMRRVLVDHARARQRDKRGGGATHVTLDDEAQVALGDAGRELSILELDEALGCLAERDARMAEAIDLVYFGGLSPEDAAEALGISRSTLFEDLRFGKAWLKQNMR